MRRVKPEFGEAVASVLDKHGLSLRAARIRTGIDHVTLSDMKSGYVPRMERVIQFARAFDQDVNEWLRLAGYDPIGATDTPVELLIDGIYRLQQANPDIFIPVPAFPCHPSALSFEDARTILAQLATYVEGRKGKAPSPAREMEGEVVC